MVTTAVVGVTLERIAYRPLRRRGVKRLYVVITALMCGLILENGNLALLGASRKAFPPWCPSRSSRFSASPSPTSSSWSSAWPSLSFLLLHFIVTRTKIGMAMRAISYDRFAVPLMGIPADTVIVFTFVLGSGFAGHSRAVAMTYPVIDPYMGALIGWKAFIAAVVGGIGSIAGAFAGGFLLGFVEIMVVAFSPPPTATSLPSRFCSSSCPSGPPASSAARRTKI